MLTNITSAEKEAIKAKSPYGLPDNPSESGMSSAEIKEAFYRFVLDNSNSIMSLLERIISESNAEMVGTDKLEDEAVTYAKINEEIKNKLAQNLTQTNGFITLSNESGDTSEVQTHLKLVASDDSPNEEFTFTLEEGKTYLVSLNMPDVYGNYEVTKHSTYNGCFVAQKGVPLNVKVPYFRASIQDGLEFATVASNDNYGNSTLRIIAAKRTYDGNTTYSTRRIRIYEL